MIKFGLLLLAGIAIFIWGLLTANHAPFQDWTYRREFKGHIDRHSSQYRDAISAMAVTGSGAALAGGLMVMLALAGMGVLD